MNSRFLSRAIKATALSFLASVSAFAFEGRIDMTMTSQRREEVIPITYYMKSDHLRIEMVIHDKKHPTTGMTMAMIYDLPAREMLIVMAEQKMVIVNKIPEPTEKDATTAASMQFKPTGRKEKIAGVEAEEMVGTSENKQTEIWVTKELGKFVMANQGASPFSRGAAIDKKGWEQFAQGGNFFPLRVIQRAKDGAPEEFHMEAVKVDKSPLPDSLFIPPADYKRLDTSNMMGEMMKGMAPGAGAR